MDRLDYRKIIEKIIQQHAREQSAKDLDKIQVVFDRERDRYLLLDISRKHCINP